MLGFGLTVPLKNLKASNIDSAVSLLTQGGGVFAELSGVNVIAQSELVVSTTPSFDLAMSMKLLSCFIAVSTKTSEPTEH
jgi:hypothetical protein